MSVERFVRPGLIIPSRDDFISSHPLNSVALDGYIRAMPFTEEVDGGLYVNFDHHHGVDRLATKSTAQQVLMAIRGGLVKGFTQDGEYHLNAFVNECDQDVSMALYLLEHAPDIAAIRSKRRGAALRHLVDMAGDLDVTAGWYPYNPKLKLMKEVAWIFRPFTQLKMEGALPRDAAVYGDVITQCCGNIALHLAGRGDRVKLDTRCAVLGGGDTWTMFEELGPEGRIGAFRKGIDAYIIYRGQHQDRERFDYTIGRLSRFIPFAVKRIVDALNEREGLTGTDRWGCDGSGVIGGSPREGGSQYDPETLAQVINEIIADLRPRPISDRIQS